MNVACIRGNPQRVLRNRMKSELCVVIHTVTRRSTWGRRLRGQHGFSEDWS